MSLESMLFPVLEEQLGPVLAELGANAKVQKIAAAAQSYAGTLYHTLLAKGVAVEDWIESHPIVGEVAQAAASLASAEGINVVAVEAVAGPLLSAVKALLAADPTRDTASAAAVATTTTAASPAPAPAS